MKKYIDCDGVILDTETGLFNQYEELKKQNPNLKKRQYLEQLDWEQWITQASVLNNSLDILKKNNPEDVYILTKVHSLQEAQVKINFFRKHDIKNNIIIVPANSRKIDVVSAPNSILVDDQQSNLEEWHSANGIAVYYGEEHTSFPKITDLDDILNPQKLIRILKK